MGHGSKIDLATTPRLIRARRSEWFPLVTGAPARRMLDPPPTI